MVTPEPRPLSVFGPKVSDAVSGLLDRAGVTVYSSAKASVPKVGELVVTPPGIELHPQRMVAVPHLTGPSIRGLPGGGAHGFLPIDRYCCVGGAHGRVYAAGDAAEFPFKHGGVGTEMADSAASAMAVLAGHDIEAEPFHPVIRAKLLGGKDPLYISARLIRDSGFESEVHDTPPWPEDEKVVAKELGGYLAQLDEAARRTAGRA